MSGLLVIALIIAVLWAASVLNEADE